MTRRGKTLWALALLILLFAAAGTYLAMAVKRDGRLPASAGSGLSVAPLVAAGSDRIVFVDRTPGPHYGRIATATLPPGAGGRSSSDYACDRLYSAANRVLCLRASTDMIPRFEAVILDSQLHELKILQLAGSPSRARLSRDGRIASWTVFVQGDSYLSVGFSTRTSILDLETGELIGSLEGFSVFKDGQPYQAPDINFWGVSMADDDNTFYATLATGGIAYLVRGDLREKSVRTLKANVECPSLSPDGTRVAFKKRVNGEGGRQPWRLHVLDLATLQETPLAETRSVDDQAAWLDDDTLGYTLPRPGTSAYDLWSVTSDGQGKPALFLEYASSPAPL